MSLGRRSIIIAAAVAATGSASVAVRVLLVTDEPSAEQRRREERIERAEQLREVELPVGHEQRARAAVEAERVRVAKQMEDGVLFRQLDAEEQSPMYDHE